MPSRLLDEAWPHQDVLETLPCPGCAPEHCAKRGRSGWSFCSQLTVIHEDTEMLGLRPSDPAWESSLLACGVRWMYLSKSRRTSPVNPSPSRPTSGGCTHTSLRNFPDAGCGSPMARTRTARLWPTRTLATAPAASPTPMGRRESFIVLA